MDSKNWIYIAFGGFVLFILYKMSNGGQSIQSLVPVQITEKDDSQADIAFQQSRLSAFQSLLGLGNTQTESEAASSLETIRSKAQGDALSLQSRTALGLQELQNELEFSLGALQGETALGLGRLEFDLNKYRTEAELEAIRLYGASRAAEIEQRTSAIQNAAQTYRNQSLERQGSILNALLAAFGAQPTYDYQSAFGGPRDTFSNKANAVANVVKSFFGG